MKDRINLITNYTKGLTIYCFLLIFSFNPQRNFAQNTGFSTKKQITQFSVDIWGTEQGLPSKSLLFLDQTKDGYLWISSFQGLFRFDGVNFEVYNTKNNELFKSNSIKRTFQHPDGTLYISTSGSGLLAFKNNSFKKIGGDFDHNIETIFFDTKDHAWIGTRGNGVFEYENGQFKAYDKIPELNGVSVFTIYKDNQENLWFTTEGRGLVLLKRNGSIKVFTTDDGLLTNKVRSVFQDSRSRIWVGTNDGLCMYNWRKMKVIPEVNDMPVNTIMEDRNGSLWMATEKGIVRINGITGAVEKLTEKNGLPHKNIQDLMLDREGSIWFATYRAGLGRIRQGKFSNYTTRTGLASKSTSGICEISKGTFLVLTDVGIINKIENHKVSEFKYKTKLANDRLKHITKDSKGNILISTYSGLLVISPDGKEKLYDKKHGFPGNQVRVSLEDHLGNIWVGTRASGLIKISPDGSLSYFNKDNSDLTSNFIMALNQDKDNKLLVGSNGTGLDVIDIENGFKVTNYAKKLTSKLVFSIYPDKENVIWIGTNAGLNRIENGNVTKFTSNAGLPTDICFDILEDDHQNLWVASSDGVMRLGKEDLNGYAKNKEGKLSDVKLYGKPDGMTTKECTGAVFSLKSSEGVLMFPTLDGVTYIDPTNIPINTIKPPVKVKNLLVDNQDIDIYQSVNFEPGKQRFTFNYTALSLIAPKKVFFKYKLEEYDKDWVDAGTERQAIYTQLPHGEYNFRVKASNNDGIWNEEGATLSFKIQPHFYETKLFYFLSVALIGLIITSGYNIRMKAIKKKNEELEALVRKRTAEINAQNEELLAQRDKIEDQKNSLELAYNDISMLSKIGQEITSTLDIDQLTEVVHHNINKLMKADGFGVGVFNEKDNTLEFKNYIEHGETLPFIAEDLDKDGSYAITCFKNQDNVFINDLKSTLAKENESEEDENVHGEIPESLIYVPLFFENKPIGVITVQSFEKDSYIEQHLTILQTLGAYISIALANVDSYNIIQTKNELITDSIRYAERIQQAVLPSSNLLTSTFKDSFIFFSPKDIVSGDFYWFNQVDNKIFIAVSDCTGHGVPGAFMSMIGSASLNEIVNKENTYAPAEILTKLHKKIRHALKQDEAANDDGMDIALCLIENSNNGSTQVTFSGAKRPMYYTDGGELKELKGNKKSIGGFQKESERVFKEEGILLPNGETIYLFSDGLVDQNAPDRKKFGTTMFKKILAENITKPLSEQKDTIVASLKDHQQDDPQRDDIAVIGIRV